MNFNEFMFTWGAIGIGISLLSFMLNKIRIGQKSNSWPCVNGTVLSTEIKEDCDRDSSRRNKYSYCPLIYYQYEIDGRYFQNSNGFIGVFGTSYSTKESAEIEVSKYCNDNRVVVYYNPENPAVSVLKRGATQSDIFICVVPISFIIFGLFQLFAR